MRVANARHQKPNWTEPMRAVMDQFGALVGRIAEQYGAVLVRKRAAFDAVL